MVAALPLPEHLPSRTASQVKNQWGDVVRHVREAGSIAVTNHANVEMVLIDTATYRRLAEDVQAIRAKELAALDALDSAFQERIAVLQQTGAPSRVDALLAARGKSAARPKAGTSF
ncbi:MAG: type II toxin-antitoxin system prevent-host-death family antitoxin [Comamonadaceae bacterium]|nr:MAG: type II toxin-antitoxin system prevent-host-death family antitoxin [Comamonadaceae bacterium]